MNIRKLFPIALILLGAVFLGAGGYTVARGFDAKDEVRAELLAQDITTPEDASIPNTRVDSIGTARSMADIIDVHSRAGSGGLSYAEMGRFANEDGTAIGTNVEAEAAKDANGKPLANQARNTAFQASALRTSLFSSVMAFEISNLVIGLGLMILVLGIAVAGLGVALAGLAIPAWGKKLHVDPVAAH
jgi:hypothetical protein